MQLHTEFEGDTRPGNV
ncbi:hypothetical protein VTO73DRAFT_7135 [Trametes versicolor]